MTKQEQQELRETLAQVMNSGQPICLMELSPFKAQYLLSLLPDGEANEQRGEEICKCEMPAKIHGENKCWRCKNPLIREVSEQRERPELDAGEEIEDKEPKPCGIT